jgi:hypothetical protein
VSFGSSMLAGMSVFSISEEKSLNARQQKTARNFLPLFSPFFFPSTFSVLLARRFSFSILFLGTMWKAGAAEVEITSGPGSPLTGYLLRNEKCERVEHQLFVKALVIQDSTAAEAVR